MIVDKSKYLSSLREIIEKYYSVLKDIGSVTSNWESFANGFMEAGLLFGITSPDEPNNLNWALSLSFH